MFLTETFWGLFLISQMCVGVLGNSLLFGLHISSLLIQPRLKKPIDSIFMHLTLVNILTIIFPLLPHVASSFGVRRFLNNVGCQAFLFSYRVSRGLSIFTTFVLGAFQAIRISPRNSRWEWLKFKSSSQIFLSFLFFWIINMLIYIDIIKNVRAVDNFTVVGLVYSHPYCQAVPDTDQKSNALISVIVIYDLVFLAFVICSSLYMVNFLYRHHRKVQYIRSPHLSSHTSPENKATYTILLLVVCFVFFYCSNNLLILYSFYNHEKSPRLEGIVAVLSSSYPTVSPFLLMRNNKIISQFVSTLSLTRATCPQK